MFGMNIGSLSVKTRERVGGEERLLFRMSEQIGDFWQRQDILIDDLVFSSKLFEVIVEATVGGSPLGDIALDDTSFTSGCQIDGSITLPSGSTFPTPTENKDMFRCQHSGSSIPLSQVCDFKYDCEDKSDEENCGTCDFETSWCGYTTQSPGSLDWMRVVPSSFGPSVDHTHGNTSGHFLIAQIKHDKLSFKDDNGMKILFLGYKLMFVCTSLTFLIFFSQPYYSDQK